MPIIRNKKLTQVRLDEKTFDANNTNRALDNIINTLNPWIDDATQAINNSTNTIAVGSTTIEPENAAPISAPTFTFNGGGGITFGSNGTDTLTINQAPVSVTAQGVAGSGVGNALTFAAGGDLSVGRSGTTITYSYTAPNPPPTEITLNADTGSITGSTFNIVADGCCIHTETSGSDTLIISSSAPCEFTATGSSNLTIITPSQIVISGANPNTIALNHFDSNVGTDSGMAGAYGGLGWYVSTGMTWTNAEYKFASGSVQSAGNVGGNIGISLTAASPLTGALGTPYFVNADGLTGDFTFEFWIKPSYTTAYGFQGLAQITGLSANLSLWAYLGQLYFGKTGAAVATGYTLGAAGLWYAIAICRSGSTIRLFVNGTLVYTAPLLDLGTGADRIVVGYTSDMFPSYGSAEGFYDEIRWSDVALYTASYTPATAAFGDYAGVASLVVDNCARQFSLNQNVSITSLTASSAVSASQLIGNQLTASNGQITNLTASNISGSNLTYGSGYFITLTGSQISASNITADTITGSFSGSLLGTASYAITSSWAQTANATYLQGYELTGGAPVDGDLMVYEGATNKWVHRNNRFYGNFFDTTTQTASATPNTALPMMLNNTLTADGFTIVSGSHITAEHNGTYNIQFSAQLDKTDSGNDDVDIWFRKDGVNVPDSNTRLTLVGNNTKLVAAWNYLDYLASGSYIEIMWYSADTDLRILAQASSSSPDRPAIPSVIVTITQV